MVAEGSTQLGVKTQVLGDNIAQDQGGSQVQRIQGPQTRAQLDGTSNNSLVDYR